jgi:hypothetical protein
MQVPQFVKNAVMTCFNKARSKVKVVSSRVTQEKTEVGVFIKL